jgi:RNA polymerase sigma-70 factor (family 1)
MTIPNEQNLILALQKGDAQAFESIFLLFYKRIYNFCLRLHHCSDDAEETVQKVFVALWEQRITLDETRSLTAYLYNIARYLVYQDFRQKVYKKVAYETFISKSPVFNECTKDEVLFLELLKFMDSIIEKLPERQKEIFKLSRYSCLTYKQIAEQLKISENTVDTQIRRALEFLLKKYKAHYI